MSIKGANTALEQAAPFRAEHVGSLLRPERLRAARSRYSNGIIDRTQLRQIENEEIRKIVHKQVEVGLRGVSDGEFRRTYWHYDFLEHLGGFEGFSPRKDARYTFKNGENSVPTYDIRNTGRISFDPAHPFIEDFRF